MVKKMEYTDFSGDEFQTKLEELLRSGWAVLLASNENIFTLMNAVKPGDFKMFMLLRTKSEKVLKVVYLVRVTAIMGEDDPERDEIRGLVCHSIQKLEGGVQEMEYTPLPLPDELIEGFVKMVIEKGC